MSASLFPVVVSQASLHKTPIKTVGKKLGGGDLALPRTRARPLDGAAGVSTMVVQREDISLPREASNGERRRNVRGGRALRDVGAVPTPQSRAQLRYGHPARGGPAWAGPMDREGGTAIDRRPSSAISAGGWWRSWRALPSPAPPPRLLVPLARLWDACKLTCLRMPPPRSYGRRDRRRLRWRDAASTRDDAPSAPAADRRPS